MLIIIIALEQLLHRVSSQLCFALLHCISILPFLVINVILIEVVDMNVWYVLRLHSSVRKGIPVKVLEPRMGLEFIGSFIVTDSILRFSLQTFIDEVCSLNTPPFRNLVAFYLYLLA